jgi:beta-lactamase class D
MHFDKPSPSVASDNNGTSARRCHRSALFFREWTGLSGVGKYYEYLVLKNNKHMRVARTGMLIGLFCAGILNAVGQKSPERVALSDELYKQHFTQYEVDGSILFFDRNGDREYVYGEHRIDKAYSPASTFKIFNALAGLDSGVIPDTSYVIPWDSVQRGKYVPWHRANSMKSAFRYSVVWYYQELARRVGEKRMKRYLSGNNYGNEDMRNTIDEFWLADKGGKLRITMQEQIAFLQELYDLNLKFSKRSQQLVKDIMLEHQETREYRLYGKTGAANYDGMSYGWYVGWIESKTNVYFFATLIESTDPRKILTGGRKGITLAVFEDLKNTLPD